MKRADYSETDFDSWLELAKSDPEALEEMRSQAVEDLISHAPADRRQRLRALQWRIDQIRNRSRHPLAACARIYGMMWDTLIGDDGLMPRLHRYAQGEPMESHAENSKVLRLPPRS